MLPSRVLYVAALLGTCLAEANLAQVLTKIPTCTQECSIKVMGDAQCSLEDISSCLCTNGTLQKQLATCVVGACNFTEQYASTTILQEEICKGIPQESRSKEIILVSIIIAAITYPIIALRFASRYVVAHRIWWDDWCILLTAFFLIPLSVLPITNASKGFGTHFWAVPAENIVPLRQTYYVTQILYVIVLMLSKMSILFLYLRIFLSPGFRRAVKIAMASLACHGVIYVFCVAFQCVPVSSIWTMKPGKCLNIQALVFSGAAVTIFEDFVTMFLPIWELSKLKFSTRRKVALTFMFALGSFASITSIIRLRYIAMFGNSIDVTWDNVDVVIWSEIEMFTGVICACLICIRPLIAKLLPDWLQGKDVIETCPKAQTSMKHSKRWSMGFSNKIRMKRLSGLSGEETLVGSPMEMGKVWVTSSASVESRSINLEDMNSSSDQLTHYYKGQTLVEADPSGTQSDS